MHAADQRRLVACRSHSVSPRGYPGGQYVMVVPDTVTTWRSRRHKAHPAGHAEGGGTVRIGKPHTRGRQAVKIRRTDQFVSITSQESGAVLIRHYYQYIRLVG